MVQPVHRREARKLLIGAVTLALLAAVGFVGMQVQAGGEFPGLSYTYVTARFDDVGTLKSGQDVSVTENGIRTGTVAEITYDSGIAVVTLRLDGDRNIYRDARARVGNESALGRKYVELDRGTPGSGLLLGSVIEKSQTRDASDLTDALQAFNKPTREALSTSLKELGGGLAGHSEDLHGFVHAAPDLLNDLGAISSSLTSPDGDLPGLLRSANQLAGRFQDRQEQIASLMGELDTTLRSVNVERAKPLGESLNMLPATLRQARKGLSDMNEPLSDVQSAVATLQPGGEALGDSAGDLRGVLREGIEPLQKLPGVSEQARPAVEELTHTVTDLRPVIPYVSEALIDADVLLHDLAPYATDIGMFVGSHDLLSGRIAPKKHYFSAMLANPGLDTASLPDPTADAEYYPAPGGSAWDETPPEDRPSAGGGR